MDWEFRESQATFTSASQQARVWTEDWVLRQMYCPACGAEPLLDFTNNKPVADFYCGNCREEYELKGKKTKTYGKKVMDGAYGTMMERLRSDTNPSLMLMLYDKPAQEVRDLAVIPKPFFTPDIIERRKALGPKARRAGWVGCNILIHRVPKAGRIDLVRNQIARPREHVLEAWAKTKGFRRLGIETKGWVFDVLNCVEAVTEAHGPEFNLADIYAFESTLNALHPDNNNIRPKIRQQLQVLRDAGLVRFLGRGKYLAALPHRQ